MREVYITKKKKKKTTNRELYIIQGPNCSFKLLIEIYCKINKAKENRTRQ